jgi:hypothetical protein
MHVCVWYGLYADSTLLDLLCTILFPSWRTVLRCLPVLPILLFALRDLLTWLDFRLCFGYCRCTASSFSNRWDEAVCVEDVRVWRDLDR